MKRGRWILGLIAAVAMATSVWLYRDNAALRRELARRSASQVEAEVSSRTDSATRPTTAASDDAGTRRGGLRSFFRLGRDRTPPQLEAPAKETRAERRERRQERIRAMLGRLDGETADEYRARVAPLVSAGLSRFRGQVDDARSAAEAAAGVTSEQSAQLDAIFDDAYAEALALTNEAITSGELTPYERNVSGVLHYVGGLGAVFSDAEARYGEVLSEDQRARMAGAGFDLGEYLGVTAPWEQLDPPPPPPGDDS